jgi:hypothetical protein
VYPDAEAYADAFVAFAEQHAGTTHAAGALSWIISNLRGGDRYDRVGHVGPHPGQPLSGDGDVGGVDIHQVPHARYRVPDHEQGRGLLGGGGQGAMALASRTA